jgi:tRNA 2-selenouridine synthase
MSWVAGLAGYKTFLLRGGYKDYRKEVFRILDQQRKVVVIGGKTGSGKTEVLQAIRNKGRQVICLEMLASHRGSAFGGLGQGAQPRNEMFQNLLASEWKNANPQSVLFLENESFTIGPILLPAKIFEAIRTSPVIELNPDKEYRVERIVNEYGKFAVEDLVANTRKLSRRLGGLRTKLAIDALEKGDKKVWVNEVLHYYDKAYQHSNDTRKNKWIVIDVHPDEAAESIADKVIEAAASLEQ